MVIPHAIVLHVTEKNCTPEELDKLISILRKEYNFQLLCSSFSSGHAHLGTTLVKSSKGEKPTKIFEAIKKELNAIDTGTMVRFNCQLTVVANKVATETLFIK